MRKRVYGRKLSRGGGARKALFRGLISAIVANGKIKTTKAKAKAIQGLIDRLINISKKNTVSAKRRVLALLGNDRETSQKIFERISKAFPNRKSGYTRLIPLPVRRGDAAEMVRMEWVKEIDISKQPKSKKEKEKIEKSTKSKKLRSKIFRKK